MKRSALHHTKTDALMAELRLPRYAVVGILESLWHLTAREAPRGDIGRLENPRIARALDWRGDPDRLVSALVKTCWLDLSSCWRLVVHDWFDHCDEAVKKHLKRHNLTPICLDKSRKVSTCPDNGVLPEPLPVPEPMPEPLSPTPLSVKPKATCFDDGFSAFREIAEAYGMSGSEVDWREARQFGWSKLDFEAREKAVHGIALRMKAGATDDPARRSLPKNYLERRMWERKIQVGPAASKQQATMEAFDEAMRRERVKVQSQGH